MGEDGDVHGRALAFDQTLGIVLEFVVDHAMGQMQQKVEASCLPSAFGAEQSGEDIRDPRADALDRGDRAEQGV